MQSKKINIQNIIDNSLTPENAVEKGYVFIDNVFDPYEALTEIYDLAAKKGFIFGGALATSKLDNRIGLYKVIKKEEI